MSSSVLLEVSRNKYLIAPWDSPIVIEFQYMNYLTAVNKENPYKVFGELLEHNYVFKRDFSKDLRDQNLDLIWEYKRTLADLETSSSCCFDIAEATAKYDVMCYDRLNDYLIKRNIAWTYDAGDDNVIDFYNDNPIRSEDQESLVEAPYVDDKSVIFGIL